MQNLLQLKGDLKEAGPNSLSLKVGNTDIFMNEALDIMQRITLKDIRVEALPDDEKRSIHLMAVAIAAATASFNTSVKAEADMYADFIIASKAIANVSLEGPFLTEEEKNKLYEEEVQRLNKEYDNAAPAAHINHHEEEKLKS